MLDKFCLHCNHKLSLFINISHHQQRALKGILLFLAHSFALDIKASLVTNILYFIKLRNTPKQRHQSQDFSLSFVQKKTFCLSDMKTILFIHFANDVHIPHLPYTLYQLHDYFSFQHTDQLFFSMRHYM
jgi:hypothetical protein